MVQVHDHAVVVKWSSAKGKSGHRPIVAALQAIASRDEVSGRDKLELDEYALELCIGGARTRALLDVLGFADSPTPDDESAVGADADERSFAMAAAATKISVSAAGSAVAAEPVHEKSSDTSGVMRLAREWPAVVGSIVRATLKVGDRRASAVCDTSTGRLTITTGVLAGRRFLDPTSAAIAVVAETGLDVPFPRDGWSEWKVNGRPIADLVAEAID
ncbi:hypothetical protein ACH46_13460 [Gordonia phthalatica]|uniref:Uncharacterized protein n=1 Tax=Gordonia phthalatica TaxID=1136941 RepID=A0A0N9NAD1_9ACTN|nr:hypothetical protein ACH46_13460 [Gordonia phthalatica]